MKYYEATFSNIHISKTKTTCPFHGKKATRLTSKILRRVSPQLKGELNPLFDHYTWAIAPLESTCLASTQDSRSLCCCAGPSQSYLVGSNQSLRVYTCCNLNNPMSQYHLLSGLLFWTLNDLLENQFLLIICSAYVQFQARTAWS